MAGITLSSDVELLRDFVNTREPRAGTDELGTPGELRAWLSQRDLLARSSRVSETDRAQAIGLPEEICNHTFRATGITAYLKNSGKLEVAQHIANHESPRTTKLYDRRQDEISLDEIERVAI